MKLYKYSVIVLLTVLFFSCFKDKSELGTNVISEIELDTMFDRGFNVDKWETLKIIPKITQKGKDKELKYEWQIDYKIVGTDKELAYKCMKLGDFPCRLKVYNEDGATYKSFDLKVNSPYEEGLLVLSKSSGKSYLSFKRLDKEGYVFLKEVYSINNPTIKLGIDPTLIHEHKDYVYIGTKNPTTLVRMNTKTFEVSNIIEYPGVVPAYAVSDPISGGVSFLGDGIIYDYETQQNQFMSITMSNFPLGVVLSDKSVRLRTGYVFFDDNAGNLFYQDSQYKMNNISEGVFTGRKLVEVVACDEGKNILAVMKELVSGKKYLIRYIVASKTLDKNYDVSATTLDETGAFLASSKSTILYYTSGNKIYAYNYLANNFPTDSFISLGDGNAEIKSLLFDKEEEKLYIAANVGVGELNANVYCYELATKRLLWKEEGVAGDIVQMIYKK